MSAQSPFAQRLFLLTEHRFSRARTHAHTHKLGTCFQHDKQKHHCDCRFYRKPTNQNTVQERVMGSQDNARHQTTNAAQAPTLSTVTSRASNYSLSFTRDATPEGSRTVGRHGLLLWFRATVTTETPRASRLIVCALVPCRMGTRVDWIGRTDDFLDVFRMHG